MKSFTGLVTTLGVMLREVMILPNIQLKESHTVVNSFLNVFLFFQEICNTHIVLLYCFFGKKSMLLKLV